MDSREDGLSANFRTNRALYHSARDAPVRGSGKHGNGHSTPTASHARCGQDLGTFCGVRREATTIAGVGARGSCSRRAEAFQESFRLLVIRIGRERVFGEQRRHLECPCRRRRPLERRAPGDRATGRRCRKNGSPIRVGLPHDRKRRFHPSSSWPDLSVSDFASSVSLAAPQRTGALQLAGPILAWRKSPLPTRLPSTALADERPHEQPWPVR
jgi:hypothetical protein